MFWRDFSLARRTTTACGVILFSLISVQNPVRGQDDPGRPVFIETSCNLPDVSSEMLPRLKCGTVSVPEYYDRPAAHAFKLAVVVFRSATQPALSDPVVYISGGPGSPLTVYAGYQARHPYAEARDLVLVDQRGVGRSEPSICPNAAGTLLRADLAVAIAPNDDAQARRRSSFLRCRDEAAASGVNLDAFGTVATARDFDRVRQALGIARWNVVGDSYGTTVAMTLMARYPGSIRTAVLDSIYPPDPIPLPWSARVASARDAFFAMCDRDAACAGSFPDLAGLYRATIDRLDRAPLTVAVPLDMRRPDNLAPLTSALFQVVVAHLLYYPDNYPELPRLIAAVHDGKTADFAKALGGVLAGGEALNMPAYVAVECRDRPAFRNPVGANADALDKSSLGFICDGWSDLGPAPVIPERTGIPTLVLAGQFDPNAPPAFSRHIADLIGTHARWIEFPLVGHHVSHFSECGRRLVAAFIERPSRVLDASCAGERALIRFRPVDPRTPPP